LRQPFIAQSLRLRAERRHVFETAHLVAETIPSALRFAGHGEKEIQVKTIQRRQQNPGMMTDLLTGRVHVPEKLEMEKAGN
jgi:hypothetical protein